MYLKLVCSCVRIEATACCLDWNVMSNHSLDLEKPVDDEDGSDSFADKFVAQIIKNLKVTLFNS